MNCEHKEIMMQKAGVNVWVTTCAICQERKLYIKENNEWKIQLEKKDISAGELKV